MYVTYVQGTRLTLVRWSAWAGNEGTGLQQQQELAGIYNTTYVFCG